MAGRIDLDAVAAVVGGRAPDPVPAPQMPGPAQPPRMRAGRRRRVVLPPVLVLGSGGGSGATTTAFGVASAAATSPEPVHSVAVDATVAGGDLAGRATDAPLAGGLQSWLASRHPHRESSVAACSTSTTAGVRVLSRGPDPLPRRETLASAHRYLERAGMLAVYDAGAPVWNPGAGLILADPRVGLAITVAARADAINRLRAALSWLDTHAGEFVIGEAVIVVTAQTPRTGSAETDHVRTFLGPWVRAVVAVPFDAHLAAGTQMHWEQLSAATRDAYRQVLGEIR
ncbi:hypothetical protein [Nocardia terpenica]|uniref:ATPase n=1 Tax=Nocardia terpenica TaxID=455432 RepID=A0A6G9ZDW0_9NOCA|nr:hypothetical protein [Nocardia terpenica]QIS23634.1 hypothetical protein F6W96_40570 [Nocardia terpenica]